MLLCSVEKIRTSTGIAVRLPASYSIWSANDRRRDRTSRFCFRVLGFKHGDSIAYALQREAQGALRIESAEAGREI